MMKKTEQLFVDFFAYDRVGVPTAHYFAISLSLSAIYFADMIKHETRQTIDEYVESKRMELAKKWLLKTDMSVSQIANRLRYASVQFFSQFFEKVIGVTPEEYKM